MLLREEKNFYENYQWALPPFLTFGQVIEKLDHLMNEDIDALPDWCRQEWNINLYMLASSATDLVEDYLVRGVINLSKLSDHVPFTGGVVKAIRQLSLLWCGVRGYLKDKGVNAWRRQWTEWLISVCDLLLSGGVPGKHDQLRLRETAIPLLRKKFPPGLVEMRMRLPAAYHSEDLTHHDFFSLARKYCENNAYYDLPHVVIGLRSAGSYCAPLVCSYLRKSGYGDVSYITIRPKSFVHPSDDRRIRNICVKNSRVILVDEPPGTGKTFARCIQILKGCGVDSESLAIMAPIHPECRNWLDSWRRTALGKTCIIALEAEEWYKVTLLNRDNFYDVLKPYFEALGCSDISVEDTGDVEHINALLSQNYERAFYVRLKKVFRVTQKNESRSKETDHCFVMAKSVGWGWLGYHAAMAASRLEGFTPRVYGVRHGMIFLEWIGDGTRAEIKLNGQEGVARRLSKYISTRTNLLRLNENPMPFLSAYQDSGLQSTAKLLSKAFGPKVSKLKRGWVRDRLEKLACPTPAFLDARMTRDEWVGSSAGMLKVDFEHHGFSKKVSHNIVDPAYDIATAGLAFRLSDNDMRELVSNYVRETQDASIKERLIYYKLLAGCEEMQSSLNQLNMAWHQARHAELNYRYMYSMKFLVSEATRYASEFCSGRPVRVWSTPMFVMDIDGVLERYVFGFPSITANGIRALSLLRLHGVCSVVNTARPLEEVVEYCEHYGFAGGVGEYGSLIWDDVGKETHVLVSKEALEEMAVLREALEKTPGIFINPFYRHSIRAYIYHGGGTRPVPDAAIGRIFQELKIKHLTARKSDIDTAILDSMVDKGKALVKLIEMKGLKKGNIAAIGDGWADLSQLLCADRGFLVGNSPADLKVIARRFGVTVVGSTCQAGLLDAVNIFLHRGVNNCRTCKAVLKNSGSNADFFWNLLCIADRSPIEQWYRAFDRKTIEIIRE